MKDGTGGLRDYNVACWLALISAMDKLRDWPEARTLLPLSTRKQFDSALDFLMSVRCFLHLRHGRDDNLLLWEAQDEAAARKIGTPDADIANAADWMRTYFGHARSIHRVCDQLLEEIPAAWSSLYRQFQQWRSRLSNADFSVVDGLIYLQQPNALHDPGDAAAHVSFHGHAWPAAQHHYRISHRASIAFACGDSASRRGALALSRRDSDAALRRRRTSRHARAEACSRCCCPNSRHRCAGGARLLPSFYGRRALLRRHRKPASSAPIGGRMGPALRGTFDELERPELLYLSLLLHDIGKGTPNVESRRCEPADRRGCMDRLDLDPSERETVIFLIGNHLEISATLRRDIFDPETVAGLRKKWRRPSASRCSRLLTYADIKAVNPDALTPWKAENVFQLYIAAFNYLNHNVDERLRADAEDDHLAQIRSLVPTAGEKLKSFLEGLPKRYLTAYSATDVLLMSRWPGGSAKIRFNCCWSAAGIGSS